MGRAEGHESPRPIRVLLCDDHRLLTQALSIVIGLEDDLEVAGQPVERGEEVLAACAEHRPDVVLMDIALRGRMDGIEAARSVKDRFPETQILVMSGTHPEAEVLVGVAEAGAVGFVHKTGDVTEFVDAIRAAAHGEMLIDPVLLARVLQRAAQEREKRRDVDEALGRLTKREHEVLELLASGAVNEDIARRLHISVPTAKTHIQNILSKLGVHSKLQAVAFATRAGLISTPPISGASTENSVDGSRES